MFFFRGVSDYFVVISALVRLKCYAEIFRHIYIYIFRDSARSYRASPSCLSTRHESISFDRLATNDRFEQEMRERAYDFVRDMKIELRVAAYFPRYWETRRLCGPGGR